MKALLCILALSVLTLSAFIEPESKTQLSTSKHALQFNNFTGAGVKSFHLTNFTNFANSASTFYKDDVAANAQYIKDNMDKIFGSDSLNFFVVIQTEEVRFSWLVWVTNENLVGSLSGINRVNPDWSYLFLKFIAPADSDDYVLITPGSKGEGVGQDTVDFITDLANIYEGGEAGDECTCNDYDTMNIGYGLINGEGRAWSTICDAKGVTNAHVYTVDGLWISIKPKNCYYTLYVSQ